MKDNGLEFVYENFALLISKLPFCWNIQVFIKLLL